MKIKNISDEAFTVAGHPFQPQEVKEVEDKTAENLMRIQPVRIKEFSEPIKVKDVKKKLVSSVSRSTVKRRRRKPLKKS